MHIKTQQKSIPLLAQFHKTKKEGIDQKGDEPDLESKEERESWGHFTQSKQGNWTYTPEYLYII